MNAENTLFPPKDAELSSSSSNGYLKGEHFPCASASASPIYTWAWGQDHYLGTGMQCGWAPAYCRGSSSPAGDFCIQGSLEPHQTHPSGEHATFKQPCPGSEASKRYFSDEDQHYTFLTEKSLGIFHSINSLLLIPSFYCKISESSSLPPTPTELEMRT